MSSLKYWLWLTSRKGVDSVAALTALDYFLTPEQVYYADPQYRPAVLQSEQWEDSLSDRLDEEGQELFERYQHACFQEQDCLQRAMFQAALGLCRELNRLTRL